MKLGTVRILTLSLLLAALAIAVAAMLLTAEGSAEYNFSMILVLLLFAAGLLVTFLWGRCPHCGRRLFVNFLRLKKCPGCGKPLDSGWRNDGKKSAGAKKC